MSISATIEFIDCNNTRAYVYKHWDGYPSGIASALSKATNYAWELPRFEADEFAASFIVANKTGPGDVRVLTKASGHMVDYHYVVTDKAGAIYVTAYAYSSESNKRKLVYDGYLLGLSSVT